MIDHFHFRGLYKHKQRLKMVNATKGVGVRAIRVAIDRNDGVVWKMMVMVVVMLEGSED